MLVFGRPQRRQKLFVIRLPVTYMYTYRVQCKLLYICTLYSASHRTFVQFQLLYICTVLVTVHLDSASYYTFVQRLLLYICTVPVTVQYICAVYKN